MLYLFSDGESDHAENTYYTKDDYWNQISMPILYFIIVFKTDIILFCECVGCYDFPLLKVLHSH